MFTNGSKIKALFALFENHTRKFIRYAEKISKLHQENEELKKQVKELHELVGYKPRRNYAFGLMAHYFDAFYSDGSESKEAKPFTLLQKVDAIMEHLGLEEKVSAETKLVKSTKKGKK